MPSSLRSFFFSHSTRPTILTFLVGMFMGFIFTGLVVSRTMLNLEYGMPLFDKPAFMVLGLCLTCYVVLFVGAARISYLTLREEGWVRGGIWQNKTVIFLATFPLFTSSVAGGAFTMQWPLTSLSILFATAAIWVMGWKMLLGHPRFEDLEEIHEVEGVE